VRALGIFAKAPIPGRVKTRLAADVGPSAAAEVYWQMGFKIVATTAGLGYRTVLWFTPADEAAFVREWLERAARLEFRPQVGRDLPLCGWCETGRDHRDGLSRRDSSPHPSGLHGARPA